MTPLTDRERELVEAAREVDRWFYDSAFSEHQAQAVKMMRALIRAYDPPKRKCTEYVNEQLSGGYVAQHMEKSVKFLAAEIDKLREALSTEEE